MPPQRLRLLVVLGSVTPPGRLRRALADGISRAASQTSIEAQMLDLAEIEVPFAGTAAANERGGGAPAAIEEAQAVILATPVYRGSMTGVLKNLLDQTPVSALERKVVGIVAMGASDHHFLGAERHLRDVLAFFGAHVLPVAVYLTSADFIEGVPSSHAASLIDELIEGVASTARGSSSGSLGPRPLGATASRS